MKNAYDYGDEYDEAARLAETSQQRYIPTKAEQDKAKLEILEERRTIKRRSGPPQEKTEKVGRILERIVTTTGWDNRGPR